MCIFYFKVQMERYKRFERRGRGVNNIHISISEYILRMNLFHLINKLTKGGHSSLGGRGSNFEKRRNFCYSPAPSLNEQEEDKKKLFHLR